MQDILASMQQLKDEKTVLQTACQEQQNLLSETRTRNDQLEGLLQVAEAAVRREQHTVTQLQQSLDSERERNAERVVSNEEVEMLRGQLDQFTRDREQLTSDLLNEKSISAQLRKDLSAKDNEVDAFMRQYTAVVQQTQQQLKQYEDHVAELVTLHSEAIKAAEAQIADLEQRVPFSLLTCARLLYSMLFRNEDQTGD